LEGKIDSRSLPENFAENDQLEGKMDSKLEGKTVEDDRASQNPTPPVIFSDLPGRESAAIRRSNRISEITRMKLQSSIRADEALDMAYEEFFLTYQTIREAELSETGLATQRMYNDDDDQIDSSCEKESLYEPTSWKMAILDARWRASMQEEYDALVNL
jgi:hypothetical protein